MKQVLFVCVENSNRSQLAEAFGHMLGGNQLKAYSAGSKPGGVVNPKAVATMAELNYDMSTHRSKSLDEVPRQQWDYVISMGCGEDCPYVPAKVREDWQIPDPKHLSEAEYRTIRDYIKLKVRELVSR